MEPIAITLARSTPTNFDSLQFNEELHQLISQPSETASSFTALLELPPTQAVELLHSTETSSSPSDKPYLHSLCSNGFAFPVNSGLVERAAKYSVFAFGESKAALEKVKYEPVMESNNSNLNSSSQPLASDPMEECKSQKSAKRKEREKKGKGPPKKSKNESSESAEKLPYVHVRARRGQATDSHSLAERARREKINARMKLLQELVPGCSKISGTALVLDEIINHVQFLQRQVELLSMRLAAVNPRIDFNLDNLFAAEGWGSLRKLTFLIFAMARRTENWQNAPVADNTFSSMVMPLIPSELQFSGNRQQYQQQWHTSTLQQPMWGRVEDSHPFIATDNSLISHDSCTNSVSLHPRAAEDGAMKAE